MQSIENKIYSRVCGNGKGWVFTARDFSGLRSSGAIRLSLLRLEKAGKIRRACRGIYYYPKYSELLKLHLSPDVDQAAQALARKFRWRIQPSGSLALNLLGLSTQVPAKSVYLSDGPNKTYSMGGQVLKFRKTALKEADLDHYKSGILVQAIKTLGQERVSGDTIRKIRRQLSPDERKMILADTSHVTAWIYDIIRRICGVEEK